MIESLEELVAALQSEIENRKKPEAQRQRRQRPGGEQGDKQLVEQIAELKMLRSLQLRVNRRTKQIGRLIHGEQASQRRPCRPIASAGAASGRDSGSDLHPRLGTKPMSFTIALEDSTHPTPADAAGRDCHLLGFSGASRRPGRLCATTGRGSPQPGDALALAARFQQRKDRAADCRALGRRRGAGSGREVFERLIQSFCVADPDTRRFVEASSPAQPLKAFPTQDFLNRDESDEFYTIHLRLFYARALTQRLMYDEALALFARIDPARVVDPATCLFYEAVCQQQLLKKTEGLETLDKLLHRTEGVAESYARVAALMQDELQSLDDQSLDGVSRKMHDSERRLDLGRGGQRVQKVQEEIVESLTELIKKMEQQANPQPQPGQGDNNSNRSSGPAEDSSIKGATAPGTVDKKNLKKQGAWGNLQERQLREAKALLNKDFPSNYREAVEQYFKKLASNPASK